MEDTKIVPSKLANIPIEKIRINPHNPRALFDPVPLQILRESIRELGILVPLLVYESLRTQDYVILDGERRWCCAKELYCRSLNSAVKISTSLANHMM